MRSIFTLVIISLMFGCRSDKETGLADDSGSNETDADGDGYPASEDCNDGDSSIHPDASESCDEIDNDCDGAVDENNRTYYRDADGDGRGNPNSTVVRCSQEHRLKSEINRILKTMDYS